MSAQTTLDDVVVHEEAPAESKDEDEEVCGGSPPTAREKEKRMRHWMGTYFYDPLPTEAEWKLKMERLRTDVWSAQVEQCPTTGRHHLQWYLRLRNPRTFASMRRVMNNRKVIVVRWPHKAFEYAIKERTRIGWSASRGRPYGQGHRSDFDEAVDIVHAKGAEHVAVELPVMYVKYHRGLHALERAVLNTSNPYGTRRPVDVTVYWGGAGTGKTTRAWREAGEDMYPLFSQDPLWFDGYRGQGTLVIDEYNGGIQVERFLQMLHEFVVDWPVKGGSVRGVWTRVILTSNYHPSQWYPDVDGTRDASLMRRFKRIVEVVKDW